MADFDTIRAGADLAEMLGGLVQSVTFSGEGLVPFTCQAAVGDASNHSIGSEEGLIGEDSVTLICATSALTWIPQDGNLVVVDGFTYRVEDVRHVPGDVAYTFICQAVAKA